jgi:hypothetical protein
MTGTSARAPTWFRVIAVVLVLWGLMGCFAAFQQIRHGADAIGDPTPYDRALFASLPAWYNPLYAVATVSGLLGAIALLVRSRAALPLYTVSLVAVIIQFGWTFAATDLLAVKGAAETVPFPLVIALVALGAVLLSRHAVRRRWIG